MLRASRPTISPSKQPPSPNNQGGHMTPGTMELEVDLAVYSMEAVKRAAYKFGDRCYVSIDCPSATQAKVTLKAIRALENLQHIAGEFQNELLDQDLRLSV